MAGSFLLVNSDYNSANLPVNLKRQSYPLSSQQQNQSSHHSFGSALNNSNNNNNNSLNLGVGSSGTNSRLNSTPNLYNSNNGASDPVNRFFTIFPSRKLQYYCKFDVLSNNRTKMTKKSPRIMQIIRKYDFFFIFIFSICH